MKILRSVLQYLYQKYKMSKYLKPIIFLFILTIPLKLSSNSSTFDTQFVDSDSVFADTISLAEKEFQIYYYHLNALLEYQEYQIARYKTIIYVLTGIIAIILTLIVLNLISKRYEKSFHLIKSKKMELVPATTLKMIFNHWKIKDSIKSIQQKLLHNNGNDELNLSDFIRTADAYGFECFVVKSRMKEMPELLHIPFVALFPNHMAIVYKIKKERIMIADAFYGYLELKPYYFVNNWLSDKSKETGVFVALLPGKVNNKKNRKIREKLVPMKKYDKRYWKQHNLY